MSELIERLEASILAGRAMHAYLISGVDSEITDSAARSAASLMLYGRKDLKLLLNDPDYMEYEGAVTMGVFRDSIRPEIYRETFGKNGRVVVFRNAGMLSQQVQNAMLKVLEEPPENTHFILTGNEYGVLPTIRSRCMVIRCGASDAETIASVLREKGASAVDAERYAMMSGGSCERAVRLFESEDARKLRSGAISALLSAMYGAPDYKWTKAKRDRAEWIEANEQMLLLCHDMFRVKCGLGPETCFDAASGVGKVCAVHTLGGIGKIADMLAENAGRLMTNAPGGAAFDRLFAGAAELFIMTAAENKQKDQKR